MSLLRVGFQDTKTTVRAERGAGGDLHPLSSSRSGLSHGAGAGRRGATCGSAVLHVARSLGHVLCARTPVLLPLSAAAHLCAGHCPGLQQDTCSHAGLGLSSILFVTKLCLSWWEGGSSGPANRYCGEKIHVFGTPLCRSHRDIHSPNSEQDVCRELDSVTEPKVLVWVWDPHLTFNYVFQVLILTNI